MQCLDEKQRLSENTSSSHVRIRDKPYDSQRKMKEIRRVMMWEVYGSKKISEPIGIVTNQEVSERQ